MFLIFYFLLVVSPSNLVTSTPMIALAGVGDDVTFTCQTTAGPNNYYVWLYNVSNLLCTESNCSEEIFFFNATIEGM